MIPVKLYRSKLDDLEGVLEKMGKDPRSVSDWFLEGIKQGQLNMDAIREKGMASLKLVNTLPKTNLQTILGLKLTEPKRRDMAARIASMNEETLKQELLDIQEIQEMLRRLAFNVTTRLYAVRERVNDLSQQAIANTERSHELSMAAHELANSVIPVLIRLREELIAGMDFCAREQKVRSDKYHAVIWRNNWTPKLQRRIKRKRLMRLRRKEEEERKAKEEQA